MDDKIRESIATDLRKALSEANQVLQVLRAIKGNNDEIIPGLSLAQT